jgi:hypothetical protein
MYSLSPMRLLPMVLGDFLHEAKANNKVPIIKATQVKAVE